MASANGSTVRVTVERVTSPDCEPLRTGSARQRYAYRVLRELDLARALAGCTPTLAGTLPLPIHTDASDLDILCEVHDADAFVRAATDAFGGRDGFAVERCDIRGVPSTLVRFRVGDLDVELFGQPVAVARQHGHRHLRVEARLLALAGAPGVAAVRALRRAGLKTEPAFARWLGLPGDDPYLAVLALEDRSDAELAELIARAPG
jgi:hypothetical protein